MADGSSIRAVLRPRRPVGVVQSRIQGKPKPAKKITPRKKKARAVVGKKREPDGG